MTDTSTLLRSRVAAALHQRSNPDSEDDRYVTSVVLAGELGLEPHQVENACRELVDAGLAVSAVAAPFEMAAFAWLPPPPGH